MIGDLQGRLLKFPLAKKNGLHPLIEAVVNSIHAIEDRNIDTGKIEVIVHRETSQQVLLSDTSKISQQITGFTVRDNGVGFTNANFISFNTIDSRKKLSRGGKGVGRLLWLKAFEKVEIESVFDSKGQKKKRTILFTENYESETDSSIVDADEKDVLGTSLKLSGFRSQYSENTARKSSTIAQYLVEQCLPFFILNQMPDLTVIDEDGDNYSARTLYNNVVAEKDEDTFNLLDEKFDVKHVLFKGSQEFKHGLNFCGDSRIVKTQKITSNNISGLENRLTKAGQDSENEDGFVYAAYVTGDYLNKNINDERSDFRIPKEADEDNFISFDEIQKKTIDLSTNYLSPMTEHVVIGNRQRIEKYIQTKQPKFRSLMKYHGSELGRIAPNLTDDQIDSELYKIQRDVDYQLAEKFKRILSSNEEVVTDSAYLQLLEELDDNSKSKLAEHVVLRHYVIEALGRALRSNSNGEYSSEDIIHKFIYPMKVESNDLSDIDDHNLWLLDERLAFHYYMSSDQPLKTNPFLETDSKKRLDLLIFNKAFAMGDKNSSSQTSVTIIEFKRPMREYYKTGDSEDYKTDPLSQIIAYIKDIREGKAKTADGRLFNIQENTPFYCYLIADLTPKLLSVMDEKDYQKMPDGIGYYIYHNKFKAYIEVISYDKMIEDARKRNYVLFDKLGLPPINFHS